jgi:O-antigen ligase
MQINSILSKDRAPLVLLTIVFATFIVMLPRYTDSAKTVFALLILTASCYSLMQLKRLGSCDRAERFFFIAVIANFLWMAFSYYFNDQPGRGDSFLWGRHFYFMFLIPMFFMFRKIRIPTQVLVLCLLVSVLVSFADIIIGILRGINYRLPGMNMNKFGPIQLCLCGLLACFLPCMDRTWKKALVIAGITAGLTTVVLSLSKATWAAVPVLCAFFIFYLPTRWSGMQKSVALILVVAILAGSYWLPVVKMRVDRLHDNVTAYMESDDYRDMQRKGTFGTRMELWKVGWQIFREQPITGAGLGAFSVKMKMHQEYYQISRYVTKYKYVHNQYLSALVSRGIPGLILLLLVMGTPMYIAIRHKPADCDARAVSLGLLFIGVTYLVVNIPDDHFEGKSANMFLSVMLALLLARISHQHSDAKVQRD